MSYVSNPSGNPFTATPGTILEYFSDTEVGFWADVAFAKRKEIRLPRSGIYRVNFHLLPQDNNLTYGQIWKNGAAHGIEHSTANNGAGATFSEDLAFSAGDLCQLYGKKGASTAYKLKEFRVNVAESVQGEVIT